VIFSTQDYHFILGKKAEHYFFIGIFFTKHSLINLSYFFLHFNLMDQFTLALTDWKIIVFCAVKNLISSKFTLKQKIVK